MAHPCYPVPTDVLVALPSTRDVTDDDRSLALAEQAKNWPEMQSLSRKYLYLPTLRFRKGECPMGQ